MDGATGSHVSHVSHDGTGIRGIRDHEFEPLRIRDNIAWKSTEMV